MTELIVALDAPLEQSQDIYLKLKGTVTTFKIGVPTLLQLGGLPFAYVVAQESHLMLDLKLYDTHDTVLRAYKAAAELGVHMVTVHADMAGPLQGKEGPKVLVVSMLSDRRWVRGDPGMDRGAGVVCPFVSLAHYRGVLGDGKLIVCPGIRPITEAADNHFQPATPAAAARAGADYIVVGRPIWRKDDPLAAAQRIIEEMGAAQ